jgi:hypothetical protein
MINDLCDIVDTYIHADANYVKMLDEMVNMKNWTRCDECGQGLKYSFKNGKSWYNYTKLYVYFDFLIVCNECHNKILQAGVFR